MRDETREFIVPIRMTFNEKEKIKKRAKITGKNLSQYMRDCAIRSRNKRETK